jgi:epoxide hydrolase
LDAADLGIRDGDLASTLIPRGHGSAVDHDRLNWFRRSAATAARFFSEAAHSKLDWVAPTGVPSGWVVFHTEPIMRRFMAPRHRWPYRSEHSEGGHFAAMEEPKLLVNDVRTFFRDLR